MLSDWPAASRLTTKRLVLEPLRVGHADELAPLFEDVRLHNFIGGAPPTHDELRTLYGRQAVGQSPDGAEQWLNWVARRLADDAVIGTLQATVTSPNDEFSAEVAWVIGVRYQQQGFASEAAAAVAAWLRAQGAKTLVAHVHPEHQASMGVARAVGLSPTPEVVDGETRWVG